MRAIWNHISQADWDAAAADAGAALQQDWGFGDGLAAIGAVVLRAELRDGARRVALAQITARHLGGVFWSAVCTRGPVWVDAPDAETRAAAYRALIQSLPLKRPRAVLFQPNEPAGLGVREARLRRVMTGYSTARIDLTRSLDTLRAGLKKKWRNRLNAAEKSDLRIAASTGARAKIGWLLEKEDAQRAARRYQAHPTKLVAEIQRARGAAPAVTLLRADCGRHPVAGMLFLRHGRGATYHIGWSSPEGKELGAHNRLMWAAIERLKAEGATEIDMGGIDTERGAGLARFKLGAGAEPMTLCGAYV